MPLPVGFALHGRFRIVAPLGQGGLASVYRARDILFATDVALKLLDAPPSPALLADLRTEFALLRGLYHPNLARVHDFGLLPPSPTSAPGAFYTAQLIDGETLDQRARREPWLAWKDIFCDALRALAFLHALDIRHGDLKPTNIMVRTADTRGVLIDLSCARPLTAEPDSLPSGSPDYLAPELLDGARVDARADIFAVGRCLQRLAELAPAKLPSSVNALAARCARPSAKGRPSTIAELLEALGVEPDRFLSPLGRSGRLVGRSDCLRSARASVQAFLAHEAGPRIVLLNGPEGVGRSRLVQELKWDLQQQMRTFELNASRPNAIGELLAATCGEPPGSDVERWLSVWERLLGDTESPIAFILDDLQNLREPNGQGVRALLRSVGENSPVFIVAADTEEWTEPLPALVRLAIDPLDRSALRAWVGSDWPDSSVERLMRSTHGFPARVRRTLDRIAAGECTEADLEREDAGDTAGGADLSMQTMPPAARRALGMAVVMRGCLEPEAIVGLEIPDTALAWLAGRGWISPEGAHWRLRVPGGAGAVGKRLGKRLLRNWHAEVLAWRERHPPDGTTGRLDENQHAALRVEHLARSGRPDEALGLLEESFALVEQSPGAWVHAAEALAETSKSEAALGWAARVERLAGRASRAIARLEARGAGGTTSSPLELELAEGYLASGDAAGGAEVLGRALRRAPAEGRPAIQALLARCHNQLGRFHEARKLANDCLSAEPGSEARTAVATGTMRWGSQHGVRVDALEALGVAASFLGDSQQARARLLEAKGLLGELSSPRRIARLLGSAALVDYRAGDFDAACDGYQRALSMVEERGLADLVATCSLNFGTLAQQQGRWAEALGAYERGMRIAVALGQSSTEVILRFNLAKLYVDIGHLERGALAAEKGRSVAMERNMSSIAAACEALLGEVDLLRENAASAKAHLESALASYDAIGSVRESLETSLQVAEAETQLGDTDSARRRISACEAELAGLDARDLRVRVGLAQMRLSLLANRPAEAVGLGHKAMELASQLGHRDAQAESASLLVQAYHAQGAAALADKHRTLARELWEEAALGLDLASRDAYWSHPRRTMVSALAPQLSSDAGRSREHQLELLIDIQKQLNSSLETRDILKRAMDAAIELTGAERGFLLLLPPSGPRVPEVAVARNVDREQVGKSNFKFSRAIAEQVFATGQPVVTADALGDDRFRDEHSVHAMQLQSVICVPAHSPSGILGALYLDNRFKRGRFREQDVDLLLSFADLVAIAITNARLHQELEARNRELEAERARVEELVRGQAVEIDRLQERVRRTERDPAHRFDYSTIVGESRPMQDVFALLDRVIETAIPVLISGESGTGKELVARAIHNNGACRAGPFVGLNCGALPELLMESELFGYVRGAFTGAEQDRDGLVVQARGGTLFLDEIGEMPATMQVKLLRVLQEREVRPLGSKQSVAVDFRLLSATNRQLREEVAQGRFREDLYYRIGVLEVVLPALRDRSEDLPSLAHHILTRVGERLGKPAPPLSSAAMRKLLGYEWPGNIRQLENILTKAVVLCHDERIAASDVELPAAVFKTKGLDREAYEQRELDRIVETLVENHWNVSKVATLLGIPRISLYRKLKRHGLVRNTRGLG